MILRLWVVIVAGICLLENVASAQSKYHVQQINTSSIVGRDLSQNSVYSICQGPKGLMWFATQLGVDVFDGTRFLDVPELSLLDGATVSELVSDKHGVWGISDSLLFYCSHLADEARFSLAIRPFDRKLAKLQSKNDSIYVVVEGKNGVQDNVLFGAWLDDFDDEIHIDRYKPNFFGDSTKISEMHSDDSGMTLYLSNDSIFVVDQSYSVAWEFASPFTGQVEFFVSNGRFLAQDNDEGSDSFRTYEITKNGIINLELNVNDRLRDLEVIANEMWLCYGNLGVKVFDESYKEHASLKGCTNLFTRSIHQSKEGTIWIGTDGAGVYRISQSDELFDLFLDNSSAPKIPENNFVWSLQALDDDLVVIGTRGKGVSILDAKTDEVISSYSFPIRHRFRQVLSSLPLDKSKDFIVGTDKGIFKTSTPGNLVFQSLRDTACLSLVDHNNRSFVALLRSKSGNSSVCLINKDDFRIVDVLLGWSAEQMSCLRKKPEGDGVLYFVGGHSRVYRLRQRDEDSWVHSVINLVPSNHGSNSWLKHPGAGVVSLSVDSAGFWYGTERLGLGRWNSTVGANIHLNNESIVDKTIYGIECDSLGRVWYSTAHGIGSIERIRNGFLYKRFGSSHIQGQMEYNANASCVTSASSFILFGGVNGITRIRPSKRLASVESEVDVNILLELQDEEKSKFLFFESQDTTCTLDQLVFEQDVVSLRLTLLDYNDPANNRFILKKNSGNELGIESSEPTYFTIKQDVQPDVLVLNESNNSYELSVISNSWVLDDCLKLNLVVSHSKLKKANINQLVVFSILLLVVVLFAIVLGRLAQLGLRKGKNIKSAKEELEGAINDLKNEKGGSSGPVLMHLRFLNWVLKRILIENHADYVGMVFINGDGEARYYEPPVELGPFDARFIRLEGDDDDSRYELQSLTLDYKSANDTWVERTDQKHPEFSNVPFSAGRKFIRVKPGLDASHSIGYVVLFYVNGVRKTRKRGFLPWLIRYESYSGALLSMASHTFSDLQRQHVQLGLLQPLNVVGSAPDSFYREIFTITRSYLIDYYNTKRIAFYYMKDEDDPYFHLISSPDFQKLYDKRLKRKVGTNWIRNNNRIPKVPEAYDVKDFFTLFEFFDQKRSLSGSEIQQVIFLPVIIENRINSFGLVFLAKGGFNPVQDKVGFLSQITEKLAKTVQLVYLNRTLYTIPRLIGSVEQEHTLAEIVHQSNIVLSCDFVQLLPKRAKNGKFLLGGMIDDGNYIDDRLKGAASAIHPIADFVDSIEFKNEYQILNKSQLDDILDKYKGKADNSTLMFWKKENVEAVVCMEIRVNRVRKGIFVLAYRGLSDKKITSRFESHLRLAFTELIRLTVELSEIRSSKDRFVSDQIRMAGPYWNSQKVVHELHNTLSTFTAVSANWGLFLKRIKELNSTEQKYATIDFLEEFSDQYDDLVTQIQSIKRYYNPENFKAKREFTLIWDLLDASIEGYPQEDEHLLVRRLYKSQTRFKDAKVFVVASWIQQVFINLIKNSHEASKSRKGHILKIDLASEGVNYVLSFEDNGTGILPEDSENIFSSTFSTKFEQGGSGIGLAFCRNVLREHGGEIHLDKSFSPDDGARFVVRLPIAK